MKVALTTREICMLIGIPLAHIATICNITEVNKLCSSNAALTSLGYRGIVNFLRWRLQPIRTEYKHAIDLNMVKSDITYATHLCTNDQIHTNQLGCAALLPGKKVILLAVAVTKVKCIYCCKFFTSWYHFMDNNNKS